MLLRTQAMIPWRCEYAIPKRLTNRKRKKINSNNKSMERRRRRAKSEVMDLIISCSSCSFLHRSPAFRREIPSPKRVPYQLKKSQRRSLPAPTSQLVEVAETKTNYSPEGPIPTHKVTVHDRQRGVVHEFVVPEDQYILHTAEAQNISLPFACRHGCCTSCAVRIKSGELRQPEALGISAELKAKGYALLCVGFPSSDLEVETQDEDEVYWLQFGRYFARGPIERDDYALELAMADE